MKLTWRIWLLLMLLLVAAATIINPDSFTGNVLIKEVQINSSAALAGIKSNEIIKQINNQKINSLEDYNKILISLEIGEAEFKIKTKEEVFNYKGKSIDFELANKTIILVYGKAKEAGLKQDMEVEKINEFSLDEFSFNEIKEKVELKAKIIILTNKQEYVFLTTQNIGLVVADVPRTKLKKGLDLEGGSRALVEPERPLNSQEMASLLETVRYRLNVYGLTDINVKEVTDLENNHYMLVELAGTTPRELEDLISKQGKFEAKIGNKTVFIGGKKDITFVCRDDASCAYIEQCSKIEGRGEACKFHFEIHLSEQAAKRHANITANLEESISEDEDRRYLNETLDLYLDDKLVDSLFISVDLKGQETTRIAISGSGVGSTRTEAYDASQASMKKLQTILITGSLPFRLKIVKLDSVSPILGKEFTKNVFIAALAVFLAVCLIIYLRYRKAILFIPIVITIVSEILLILCVASIIKWNLDLASIAGIIAAIGTGVDDQIVMIDEIRTAKQYSIKERIRRAFFIIMGAYATTVVAMLPLWWAGAGLLRGFAVTTIIGITIGVFITRPAFADILRRITKD